MSRKQIALNTRKSTDIHSSTASSEMECIDQLNHFVFFFFFLGIIKTLIL